MPLSPTNRLPSGFGKRRGAVAALSAANSSLLNTRPGEWKSLPAGRIIPPIPAPRPPAAPGAPPGAPPGTAPAPRPPPPPPAPGRPGGRAPPAHPRSTPAGRTGGSARSAARNRARATSAATSARTGKTGRIAQPLAVRNAGDLRTLLQPVVPEDLQRRHVAVSGDMPALKI